MGELSFPTAICTPLLQRIVVLLTGLEPQQLIDPHTLAWNWRWVVNLSPRLGSILDRNARIRPSDRFDYGP
jgi:serine/threonine-protein kinase